MSDVKRPTIALDFDGVLHAYSRGWGDGTIYDPPVEGAVEAVRALAEDFDLIVSTCRQDVAAISRWIRAWFDLQIPVTASKPIAAVYVDDRGLRFEGDWRDTFEQLYGVLDREPTTLIAADAIPRPRRGESD